MSNNEQLEQSIQQIRQYEFPWMVKKRLKYMYPSLDTLDIDLVLDILKDYFILIRAEHLKIIPTSVTGVGVPSVIVDDAWHLFLLNTKDYREFCTSIFNDFVDHIPDDETTDHIMERKHLHTVKRFKDDVYVAYSGYKHLGDKLTYINTYPGLFHADFHFNVPDGFIYTDKTFEHVERLLPERFKPTN